MPCVRVSASLIAVAILLNSCAKNDGPTKTTLTGSTMGTTYTVIVADCEAETCSGLRESIDARLKQLIIHLSHFDSNSELSRFNEYHGRGWFAVTEDFARVVDYAQSVSRLSGGAFDITVAPAVDAWGFGPVETNGVPPATGAVTEARKHIGFEKLEVRLTPAALRKLDPLLRIDLSAIAKGFGVDQLAYLLEANGLHNYMVEIGGEIRTAGVCDDGKPWRIGIQAPADDTGVEYVILPRDSAVATSGDYRNYYMVGDRRISHTIDPGSGSPIDSGLASVTVVAPNAMQADALATALMVIGPEHGIAFAERHDVAALLLVRTGEGLSPLMSSSFRPYLLDE